MNAPAAPPPLIPTHSQLIWGIVSALFFAQFVIGAIVIFVVVMQSCHRQAGS